MDEVGPCQVAKVEQLQEALWVKQKNGLGYQMLNNPFSIALWARARIGWTREEIPDIPRIWRTRWLRFRGHV